MTTVDSWPKTLLMPTARSWNSTTETHLIVNKNFHNWCDITVAATEQQKLFVRLEKMQNSLCLSSSTMSSVSFFYNLISWPRWPVLFNIVLEKWRYYWLFSCFFNLFTIESFESFSLKLSNNISSFVFWVSDCCF